MVKSHATKATPSGPQERARIVEEYDRLISKFEEDPFRPSAVCGRSDGLSKAIDNIGTAAPKQRHELLKEVTEKSLRCAELIEMALAAADKFRSMDKKVADAHREFEAGTAQDNVESEDDDVEMDGSDDDDGESALLLKDLITASEEMQQASKNLSQIGVVTKSTRASRELLSSTEQMLQTSLDALSAGGQSAAVNGEFRDLYMEEFTSAFGDDLDQFRQEDRFESKDVTYLISCIQSGADIFTPQQKKLFVESAASSTIK